MKVSAIPVRNVIDITQFASANGEGCTVVISEITGARGEKLFGLELIDGMVKGFVGGERSLSRVRRDARKWAREHLKERAPSTEG